MLDVAQVSNILDYFVQSSLLLYGRRVDLDLEDAHREVCPPVCRVQVVFGVIRHVQVRPESMNIFWNKRRSREKKSAVLLDIVQITSLPLYYKTTNIMMMTYLPIEKPDDTKHKNKYKERGGESGTAKRIT